MAIQARLLRLVVTLSLILAPGALTPVAAEPLLAGFDGWDGGRIPFESAPRPDPLGERPVVEVGSVSEAPSVAEPEDEWDAIADAFAESTRLSLRWVPPAPEESKYPVTINAQVQFFVDRFTIQHRDVVTLWVNRSARYLGMIRDVMRKKGLPEELAFTAMIESGFNPRAVSRVGAKGMWQFMASTARSYGLRVDPWIDERLDPEKSTIAAAAYLHDLHKMFGSWPLAQAAYNAGEVKVARAIRVTGSTDFWMLARTNHLRRETKEFVPQIHAATVIGRDPERYGFDFDDRPAPPTETVPVPPSTDLRRLSAAAGMSQEALRALNPVLLRGVTPPGAPYELRVPVGAREGVLTALAVHRAPRATAIAKSDAGKTSRASAVGSDVHVVRPQDTVSGIAKRYGVSVNDVVRWNKLARQDSIRPGDRLRVAADRRQAAERDGQGGFR
jgi:membrane-bound lytic murein transglycosylase D